MEVCLEMKQMPDKKTSKPESKSRNSSLSGKHSSIRVNGNFKNIKGHVNIAGRDIINNITNLQQRALTAAEGAKKARLIETELLAEGIGKYASDLKDRIEDKSDLSTLYRGLLEYRLADTGKFFGRDEAIKQCIKLLSRSAFSVLHAESGAGKTSLLQAGVMPVILASGHLPVYLRPYDKNPEETIKSILLPNSEFASSLTNEPLDDFLRHITNILGAKTMLVLILDQFEEFFYRVQEIDQNSFIDSLVRCVNNPSLNVHWLLSLRKEYFSDLTSFRPGIPDPFENTFYLQPMSRAEAEEAIAKPARLKKIDFEKGLIPELLNDLGDEQILPPHIQLVCSALVDHMHNKQLKFTHAEYVKSGRAQGILKNHLERVLTQKVPKNRIILCQQVLEGLVTSTQKRVLRTEQELFAVLENYSQVQVRDTISLLATNRLLRGEDTDKGPAYELAHDILLDEIKLNPGIVKRKQAEELLEQGVRNWHTPQQIILGEDILAVIRDQEQHLVIKGASAELLFWSTIKHGKGKNAYVKKLTEEQKQSMIQDIQNKKVKSLSKVEQDKALWMLKENLTTNELVNISVKQGLRWIWRNIQALTLISIAILILGMMLQYLMGETSIAKWQELETFEEQCLGGVQSASLISAINVAKPSEMMVHDNKSMLSCISKDYGKTWEIDKTGLPSNSYISSISFNKNALILTDKNIFIQKSYEDWRPIILSNEYENEEPSSVTQSMTNANHIFIGMKSGLVLHSIDSGSTWDLFETLPEEGLQSLSNNGVYIVATTPTTIFFRHISEGSWKLFRPKQEPPIKIRTAIMISPNIDTTYVLTSDGIVLSGFIENDEGLKNINSDDYPPHLETIAAFQSYELVGNHQGLHYRQAWTFFNWEWWREKFNR